MAAARLPLRRPASIPFCQASASPPPGQDEAEWGTLNALLRRRGLQPISIAASSAADAVALDSRSSLGIRLALKTLLEDTDRQQRVMHGLMEANRTLSELEKYTNPSSTSSFVHECLRGQVEHRLQLVSYSNFRCCCYLSQTKYQQQQEKLQEQEEIIARLQRELCRAGAEEQQRIDTQTKMFCQFCNRAPKSLLDQQFLSLIDHYESQINQLKKELRQYKKAEDHTQREVKSKAKFLNLDATPNYRALLTTFKLVDYGMNEVKEITLCMLQSFQNQLVETKAKNEQLLLENTKLKKDLETRSSGSCARGGAEENKEPESTADDELHAVCQQYLQVLSNIDSIIQSPRAPPLIHRRSRGSVQNSMKENGQECGFEHLPLTIEMWADQLVALKNSQTPSLPTLFAMVSHFQKLFDVSSLNGIYPRMNEVYTKLGELTNAMRNLHEILELDRSVPPTVVVDTVGKLCDVINENVTEQLQQLLGTQDIHSIISKLEEHECFFPPFQALIQDLLSLLEIRNLDDILPAVRKLKWAAS
ncbi:hypothetical protein ASZ78_012414 [Callipepla squamata]|uniref:Centrosomal protein of 70 kDa n=1 Tax=Callipepla squamata TaxID=9009 RepID=A0A226MSU5_CALSU|nr:hypothetical protein ASZ78_012414 [Callipepla squamata]